MCLFDKNKIMNSLVIRILLIIVGSQSLLIRKSVDASGSIPLIINTWSFTLPTIKAWETVQLNNGSAIDGIVDGCTVCETEIEHCGLSVGYGGNPNELGDTTLDAMIMDGITMNVGAVGALRNIRNAIGVARMVLENTRHSLLVGDDATRFAVNGGFTLETSKTEGSIFRWNRWRIYNNCQPNFWKNVKPNPTSSCGPFAPLSAAENPIDFYGVDDDIVDKLMEIGPDNHDTIGMIVIDQQGNLASGASTNGLRFKIPGRVGDTPIVGAGAYADNAVGAAAGTGNGDVMMRFLPSMLAVEFMRSGMTPGDAAHVAIERIIPYYPEFSGAIIVTDKDGNYDAACHGMTYFPYSIYTHETGNVIERKECF